MKSGGVTFPQGSKRDLTHVKLANALETMLVSNAMLYSFLLFFEDNISTELEETANIGKLFIKRINLEGVCLRKFAKLFLVFKSMSSD